MRNWTQAGGYVLDYINLAVKHQIESELSVLIKFRNIGLNSIKFRLRTSRGV